MGSAKVADLEVATSYGAYLRLDELLTLQRPLAQPSAHDELLFIVVHQAYELWFRLLLHELAEARDALLDGDAYRPRLLLERCQVVERLMVSQFDVLDTLSPQGFLEFRAALADTSGAESAQFRAIERLSGSAEPRPPADGDGETRPAHPPTLWEGFLALLRRAGYAVELPLERRDALLDVARDPRRRELWQVAEGLLGHDQGWSLWRGRHALLVERQIGAKPGTGGSSGVGYLRSRQHHRFFPELWEVRGRL
ncbi:tryptophan 2,3-dioxygenase family protein [Catellatospora sp. KI3]|uniref:tryptophan 2,3-dioxygenase family protein n=1 Tax=Catellatospora sp. KI3 TaxID=3041620 RepID=UPI0024822163|nr:tryptophan 2,3-dioxygenase family protein [Catellatospora sp. KI3]MDI1465901.1 tryptophan 2,3-dioxygenase family protein [Catellatospora sp. KI3]